MAGSCQPRERALKIINSVLEEGKLSHIVLKQQLDDMESCADSGQQKAFVTRLAMGTIEKKITLDYVINGFASTKIQKMKPFIRGLLRMSVYQLLFMDSVPDSAACNEAVKLAKAHRYGGLAPFVNGVLRNIARQKDSIAYPDSRKDHYGALSVRYSVPVWILKKWEASYGRKTLLAMLGSLERVASKTCLRINTSRADREEVLRLLSADSDGKKPEQSSFAANVVTMESGNVTKMTAFQKGYVQVQDVSSVLAGQISGVQEGAFCMDLCASPGGKTCHLADLLRGTGRVLAGDISQEKIGLIKENLKRCGFDNVCLRVWDAMEPDERYFGKADLVLADVPCSGLGVLRNKPDIRYRLKEEDIGELANMARKILTCAVKYLKQGGTLLFSTCTITREENEVNRRWLLENFDLDPVDISGELSAELLAIGNNQETAREGYLQLMITDDYDGFFLSKMIYGKGKM